MGHGSSTAGHLGGTVVNLQDELVRHTHFIKEVALLTYEDFQKYILEVNKLSHNFVDAYGKKLVFAVKKGTDATLLWKGTVTVACVKVDVQTKKVESCKFLNLKQFLQVYKTLQTRGYEYTASSDFSSRVGEGEYSGCADSVGEHLIEGQANSCAKLSPLETVSLLLDNVDNSEFEKNLDELKFCCICLERNHEVVLPCAHSYCLPCIEQWNVNHKTCPICREDLETTDDTWVISDTPDSEEMAAEVRKVLFGLTETSP